MTSPWTYGLIAIAVVIMAISYRVPRAWTWIGVGGLSFFASTLFYDYVDKDSHPFFTLLCDTCVFLAVYRFHKEEWEVGIALAFLVSVFSSAVMLGFSPVIQDWVYASLLELCNLGALLWIGHVGLLELIGRREGGILSAWSDHLHSPRRSLR